MDKFTSIGRNMTIVNKYFKIYLRDRLVPYEINASEGIVLLMMHRKENEENTQDELIKEIHYDKGVMTRTMKELEKKGFVERKPNPNDSRSFLFSLTEKGKEFKHIIIKILQDWNKELLGGISDENLAIVEEALGIMAENSSLCYSALASKINKKK